MLLLGVAALLGTALPFAAAAPEVLDPPASFQRIPEVDDPANPGDVGGPDVRHLDGRFLILTGPGNFSLPEPTRIQLGFDATVARVEIHAFDANADGMWDQRTGDPSRVVEAPLITYRLYADPEWWHPVNNVATRLRNGEVLAPVAEVLSSDPVVAAADDQWVRLFDLVPTPAALSTRSGEYAYLFEARLTPKAVNHGLEACGYKLALNGRYRLGKDTLLGFVGGVVDARADTFETSDLTEYSLDMNAEFQAPNAYDGTFRFSFDTSALCSPLELTDIDADWNAPIGATPAQYPGTLTGVPPDDGGRYVNPATGATHDGSLLRLSPAVQWVIKDPDGVTRYTSQANSPFGRPSVSSNPAQTESTKTTTLDLATLRSKPGRWTWIWQGVDLRNFVFIKANAPLGTLFPPPSAGGRVFCDADEDGEVDAGEVGIPDVTVTLQPVDAGGNPNGTPKTTTTDALGAWRVEVPEGDYRVTTDLTGFAPLVTLPLALTVDRCDPKDTLLPYRCGGQICGHVFCDANSDGRYVAPGDTPIGGAGENVVVRLQRYVDGAVVETVDVTTTGGLEFCANGLVLGEWRVQVVEPNGLTEGLQKTVVQPKTALITLAAPTLMTVDLGYVCTGRVEGRVFCDFDDDDVFDAGVDEPHAGILVSFTPTDPVLGAPFTVATDAEGVYGSDVPPGEWTVAIVPNQPDVAGLTPLGPLTVTTTVSPKETATIDFRYRCQSSIEGIVYRNPLADCDETYDVGTDTGIGGVTVRLERLDAGGFPIPGSLRTTVTDSAGATIGRYRFLDLLPGSYRIEVQGAQPVLANLTASTPLILTPNVPSRTAVKDQNFGFCPLPGISGTVWVNKAGRDCDGVKDPDEVGLTGVTVSLWKQSAPPPAPAFRTTVTNAAGFYEFLDLEPGSYVLQVTGGVPADVHAVTSTTLSPVLLPNANVTDQDFGYCPLAELHGIVFRGSSQRPCDDVRQQDETGIPNVTVRLVGLNPAVPEMVDVTDASGAYSFAGLRAGTYRVRVDGAQPVLVTLLPSTPLAVDATLLPGDSKEVDFGFCPPSEIRGIVFRGAEGRPCDDVKQQDEAGIPGVTVELTGIDPVRPWVVDVTDALGAYAFPGLEAGTYQVRVDGGQPVLVNLSPSTPLTVAATVLPGETKEVDFGLCPLGLIRGTVFLGKALRDCDGEMQQDEAGIAGVSVQLLGLNPVRPPVFDVTDAQGRYEFPNLPAGTYRVLVPGGQPVLLNLTPSTPLDVTTTLPTGGTQVIDFGFCPPGEVRGVVYRESAVRDCDGVRQADDVGIAGVRVVLEGTSPVRPPITVVTNAFGAYAFLNVQAGTYRLTVDGAQPVLVDLSPSTALDVGVSLLPGEIEEHDFGFCPVGGIQGRVFIQPGGEDCTGVFTPGVDQPVAGVLVTLEFPDGAVQAVPTDAQGSYAFTGLGAGTYVVTVDDAAPVLVNVSPSSDTTVEAVLLPGETKEIDFPFCRQSLSGHVFREPLGDCDGDLGPEDQPIAGVKVVLTKVDSPGLGTVFQAATDAAGFYAFADIPAGAYEVKVGDAQPVLVGLTPSTPTVLTPLVMPGAVVTDQDFGYCPQRQSLCGWVYREQTDCDGVRDVGVDVGIGGVEVALRLQGDDQVFLTTTESDGRYCFTDLAPGTYEVSVAGLDQPELVTLEPSTPTEQVVPVPAGSDVDDVNFGFCGKCDRTPCCEGDLHEVVVETQIWVGWCTTFDLNVRFYACSTSTTPLDRVSAWWRGPFHGPIEGVGEILKVESVTIVDGTARIRIRITAAGPQFKCGVFGREIRRISVCLNGCQNDGCAAFRCETLRPGARFTWTTGCPPIPPCPTTSPTAATWVPAPSGCKARFLVIDTWSVDDWKACENPPPCTESPPPCPCTTSCECKPCEGGVTKLAFRYTGWRTATIRAENAAGDVLWTGLVPPLGDFRVAGKAADGTIGPSLKLFVNGTLCATIPTSCSTAIGPGYVKSSFRVVSGESRAGPLCALTANPTPSTTTSTTTSNVSTSTASTSGWSGTWLNAGK